MNKSIKKIRFLNVESINPDDLLPIANDATLRKHLINHPLFTSETIRQWIADKSTIDALEGCRVRVVSIDNRVAGWCGIQPDDKGVELAIVLSQKFWGYGLIIFNALMDWAKELGHKEVLFHLLDTRREYKALNKIAYKTDKIELLGGCFTSYYIKVDQWHNQRQVEGHYNL